MYILSLVLHDNAISYRILLHTPKKNVSILRHLVGEIIAFRIRCLPCNSHWGKWPKTFVGGVYNTDKTQVEHSSEFEFNQDIQISPCGVSFEHLRESWRVITELRRACSHWISSAAKSHLGICYTSRTSVLALAHWRDPDPVGNCEVDHGYIVELILFQVDKMCLVDMITGPYNFTHGFVTIYKNES